MTRIVQKENLVLRDTAEPIPEKDIKKSKYQKLIKKMAEALASQHDGVALAAPQIGKSLRIFIVSGKIFEKNKPDLVFINPEFVDLSKEKEEMHEGCLSVRGWYGSVKRHVKATVRALDKDGKSFTVDASGLLAQIFQHEIDHLNGVLFIDKASELHEATDEDGVLKQKDKK